MPKRKLESEVERLYDLLADNDGKRYTYIKSFMNLGTFFLLEPAGNVALNLKVIIPETNNYGSFKKWSPKELEDKVKKEGSFIFPTGSEWGAHWHVALENGEDWESYKAEWQVQGSDLICQWCAILKYKGYNAKVGRVKQNALKVASLVHQVLNEKRSDPTVKTFVADTIYTLMKKPDQDDNESLKEERKNMRKLGFVIAKTPAQTTKNFNLWMSLLEVLGESDLDMYN